MKPIHMVDLHGQYLPIKQEINEAIQNCIDSSAFINGRPVSDFQYELEELLDSGHVIPCANGTDALQIAMMSLGLKEGDEVIIPAFCYVAAAEAAVLLKLKVVFADVDPGTFNITSDEIEKRITNHTKAIIVVHLFGQCAGMESILRVAEKYQLPIIEDTAQAIGSEYTLTTGIKKAAGTIGVIGTTSFFPTKNLGCFGDGGALFTDSAELAERIRKIANHGQVRKYHHELIGVNSRLDSLQAAILLVKLKYLEDYNVARANVANFYDEALAGLGDIEIPVRQANSTHVFHQYTIKINTSFREQLKSYLKSMNIPSMIYYPIPLHLQPAYQFIGYRKGEFKTAESLCDEVLSLPMHTELQSDQLNYICDHVIAFAQNHIHV